jgi:hypothetical protein
MARRAPSLLQSTVVISVCALIVSSPPPSVRGADTALADAAQLFRAALPQLRASHPDNYDTPEKLQAAWKRFLETFALARTARATGYAERPEIRYRIEQLLAQELILRDAEQALPIHSITEAQIDAHLARHRDKFESPAAMSIHEIVIRFDPLKDGDRAAQWEQARRVRKSLGQGPVSLERFIETIQAHSDPGFVRTNGGFLGVVPISGLTNASSPLPGPAARELLADQQPGRVSEVHEFGHTFRIYRLSGIREAVQAGPAAVRDGVRRALYYQARAQRIHDLAARSGLDLDTALSGQQVEELLAPPAGNRVQSDDLPPSPAGTDIPVPDPSPVTQPRRAP